MSSTYVPREKGKEKCSLMNTEQPLPQAAKREKLKEQLPNYYQIKTQKISIGENMEKLEPLRIADWNVKWHGHCGKQNGGSTKS